MGRGSTKENKNYYQLAREDAGLTRDKASEAMEFVSADRIEKIENEKSPARPEEILAMSKCYKKPLLCNQYCANDCPIGQEFVPEIEIKNFSQISMEVLSMLNSLEKEKDRIIDIAADGRLTEDELPDFLNIHEKLKKISLAVDGLMMWFDHAIANGEVDAKSMKE